MGPSQAAYAISAMLCYVVLVVLLARLIGEHVETKSKQRARRQSHSTYTCGQRVVWEFESYVTFAPIYNASENQPIFFHFTHFRPSMLPRRSPRKASSNGTQPVAPSHEGRRGSRAKKPTEKAKTVVVKKVRATAPPESDVPQRRGRPLTKKAVTIRTASEEKYQDLEVRTTTFSFLTALTNFSAWSGCPSGDTDTGRRLQ